MKHESPFTNVAAPVCQPIRRKAAAIFLMAVTISATCQTLPPSCGSFKMDWGPFDYRPEHYIQENTYRSHKALLEVVEVEHFTPEIEAGLRGKKVRHPGKDLAYTLAVFPNHHRALIALSNLAIRTNSLQPIETRYSVECYFLRGVAFRPDDHMVRMIYANYLIQVGKTADAEAQIDTVAMRNPDSAFTQRNLGLLYFEIRNFEKSLAHAHKAIELGLNADLLKDKLKSVGKWQDPQPTTPLSKE